MAAPDGCKVAASVRSNVVCTCSSGLTEAAQHHQRLPALPAGAQTEAQQRPQQMASPAPALHAQPPAPKAPLLPSPRANPALLLPPSPSPQLVLGHGPQPPGAAAGAVAAAMGVGSTLDPGPARIPGHGHPAAERGHGLAGAHGPDPGRARVPAVGGAAAGAVAVITVGALAPLG